MPGVAVRVNELPIIMRLDQPTPRDEAMLKIRDHLVKHGFIKECGVLRGRYGTFREKKGLFHECLQAASPGVDKVLSYATCGESWQRPSWAEYCGNVGSCFHVAACSEEDIITLARDGYLRNSTREDRLKEGIIGVYVSSELVRNNWYVEEKVNTDGWVVVMEVVVNYVAKGVKTWRYCPGYGF